MKKENNKMKIGMFIGIFLLLIGTLILISQIQGKKENKSDLEKIEINEEDIPAVERIDPTDEEGLAIGNTAPDFEVESLDDGIYKLSDIRGKKKILLNFWTTWCPPCQKEMPDLQKVKDNHNDVEVIAVNLSNQESYFDAVEEFVKENDLDLTVLMDKDAEVMDLYQVKPIPTSYFIDSKGYIGDVVFGPMSYDQMVEKMKKLN